MNHDTQCPHCWAEKKNSHAEPQWNIYACGAVSNGVLRSSYCEEREKSQKLEAEVERLREEVKSLNNILEQL